MNPEKKCPKCNSTDVFFSKKKNQHICEDCQHIFKLEGQRRLRRIFISYGHDQHTTLAQRLKNDLEQKGHQVWFDLDRLKPGVDWETYIEEGLSWIAEDPAKGCVLLLMTPHSIRRPDGYCLNEITKALDRSLPIVPVMVVWCEPPLSIIRIQWLDMQDCLPLPEKEVQYEGRLERLLNALDTDHLDYEGNQSRLIRILEPLPFDADIAHHLRRFTGRKWIFKKIDEWLSNPNVSRIFWIIGLPGVGKTTIAAWLCYHRREVAAFHLCRHGHVQKSDPRRAVLSIAYQLSTQLLEYHDRLSALHLERFVPETDDARTLFDRCIVQPLSANFPAPDRTILIVIDALDEASEGGRNELATFIASEFNKTPDWLRLIITSRPDPEVTQPLQALTPYILDTSSKENISDLHSFLNSELKVFTEGKGVPKMVIKEIIDRSEGLFLYADWVREEVHQGRLSLENIEEFPQGLGGVYAQYIRRQFPDITIYKEKIRPALEIIFAAQESIDLNILGKALNWKGYDQLNFIRSLGSIFQVMDNCIRPFHKSISEWITVPATAGDYIVDPYDGDQQLAEFGWHEYKEKVTKLSPYSLAHLPHHLCQSGRWDDLEIILTDLLYIEAKCAAGLTYNLIKDYNLVLDSIPEAQAEKQEKIERQKRLDKYVKDIIAYAKREINQLEIIPSADPWNDKKINKETERLLENPDRSERIKMFYQFINMQSHNLVRYNKIAGFCIQQAYNFASAGILKAQANRIVDRIENKNPILCIQSRFIDNYNLSPLLSKTLVGHTGPINSVVLLLDNRAVVTGGNDTTLRVWDISTGNCTRVLLGHTDLISTVSASANGRIIVSGSYDNSIRVWDLNTGICSQVLKGHTDSVASVAISAQGDIAISGGFDKCIRVWDLKENKCVRILKGHSDIVSASIIPVGTQLVISASYDKTIRIWDLNTGRCISNMSGHKKEISSLAYSDAAGILISGSYDGTLRSWDIGERKCKKIIQSKNSFIEAVSISGDGRIAASCARDKKIRLWNLITGTCVKIIETPPWPLTLVLSADGKILFSGSYDGLLRIWDIEKGYTSNFSHKAYVGSFTDKKEVVSEDFDKSLRKWSAYTTKKPQEFKGHSPLARASTIATPGKIAASANRDNTIRVFNWDTNELIFNLDYHTGEIADLAMSMNGQILLSGGRDKKLICWDLNKGQRLKKLTGHQDWVNGVDISSDGTIAVSGGGDRVIYLWNLIAGKRMKVMKGHTNWIRTLKFSPDNSFIVSGDYNAEIRLWKIVTGKYFNIIKHHTKPISALALSPDGRTAISGSYDQTICVWNIRNGELLGKLEGHSDAIHALSIAPDGNMALSGSWDKTIRLWDLKNHECLAVLAHDREIHSVSFLCESLTFGDSAGNFIISDIKNIKMQIPSVTITYLYDFQRAEWYPSAVAVCNLCRKFFQPPQNIINFIKKLDFQLNQNHIPCIDLPDEAWDEPALISKCSHCQKPLKFNPFIVDNRAAY
jgi:WD40 repeat protein